MLVFPILYTTRLKLRKIQPEDFQSLVKYANNKIISDNIINIPHPYREPDAAFRMSYVVKGFKSKSRFVFVIAKKETNNLIGEISLHLDPQSKVAELGYWIGQPFWSNGYATEAAQSILDFGFETLQLSSIFASSHIDNIGSEKVLIKIGMTKIKTQGNVSQFKISK